MPEKNDKDTTIVEENVVAKVAELMDTLDQVKKYGVLSRHFKTFALIVVGSIIICSVVNILLPFSGLLDAFHGPQRFFLTFPLVLIPTTGVLLGMLYVRRKVNRVKTGEWKGELSQGFPSALKSLSEIDWDEAFNEVSSGRLGYVMYGLVKGIAYGIIAFFILGFGLNLATYLIMNKVGALGYASFFFSLLVAFLYLKNVICSRFFAIGVIVQLAWELRRVSDELRRAEL
jgi:F0F1-type ATP synthase assembly protein I